VNFGHNALRIVKNLGMALKHDGMTEKSEKGDTSIFASG